MSVAAPDVVAPNRYVHVTWDAVTEIVRTLWGASALADERAVAGMLLRVIATLGTPPSAWRAAVGQEEAQPAAAARPPSTPSSEPSLTSSNAVDDAVVAARLTSDDGRQRAVELEQRSLEALQDLRLHVRRRLCAEPLDSPLRRVMPWLWNADSSGGTPLTNSGAENGYELRLSRYTRQLC
jgi:hypothetical protein